MHATLESIVCLHVDSGDGRIPLYHSASFGAVMNK
jgi:hypothetical protein